MTSLMSDIKNPFLKDYSTTSLLKKNAGALLIQSRVKENQSNFNCEYKKSQNLQKQNISSSSSISNPFSKKSLNALEFLHQKRDPCDLRSSDIRSWSQNRSLFRSIEKNIFYKGLQDLGTKQMMKNERQKQARQQLKNFGAETLRYQYVPATQQYQSSDSQEKNNPYLSIFTHEKLGQKHQQKKYLSYKSQYSPKQNITINSEYYGYGDSKEIKEDDDFVIQKVNSHKKTSIRKPASDNRKSTSNFNDKMKKERCSYYENIPNIPEDTNQDFQTAHIIKINQLDEPQFIRTSLGQISSKQRIPIEPEFKHESSRHSYFSNSQAEMYQSGANFFSKFSGKNEGPLNIKEFDDDGEKESERDFDLDQFEDIEKKEKKSIDYPEKLQYNNKIYFKIPL